MGNEVDIQRLQHKRAYARQYYAERKAKDPSYGNGNYRPRSEAQWDWHLKNAYGIDSAAVVKMFDNQAGACAICGGSLFDTCHVDHCHTTNKVRGLLCRGCNQGLGSFCDNPAALLAAATYIGG